MSEFSVLVRNFWVKLVNGLAHSRSGLEAASYSYTPYRGTSWFNLAIKDYEMVTNQIKQSGTGETIGPGQTYYVQFYLFTKEKRTLILETWEMTALQALDSNPRPQYLNVTEKMSGVLKTVLMYSKHTTAHKCSLNQNRKWYIFCLKVSSGYPDASQLGEYYETVNLGQVVTPTLRLKLAVHYRTKFTFPHLNPSGTMMPIDPNHFKQEESSTPVQGASENSQETTEASDSNSDVITITLPSSREPLGEVDFPLPLNPSELSVDSGITMVTDELERSPMFLKVFTSPKPTVQESTEEDTSNDEMREAFLSSKTIFEETFQSQPASISHMPLQYLLTQDSELDFHTFPNLTKKPLPEESGSFNKFKVFSGYNNTIEHLMQLAEQKCKPNQPLLEDN